jgi:two-component system cell cycle sensor histidine kinase/response regulator CckA
LSSEAFQETENLGRHDTILIIEDEEVLRDLLKMMLEEDGIKVLAAGDGVEAVEIFEKHKDEIGLVLSDMGLPRMGGWDAFLKMKEISPHVKVILASGYFSPHVKSELLKSGARDFIQKPYNPPEILAMIHRMLDEQK